jgi:hypothetical protein
MRRARRSRQGYAEGEGGEGTLVQRPPCSVNISCAVSYLERKAKLGKESGKQIGRLRNAQSGRAEGHKHTSAQR